MPKTNIKDIYNGEELNVWEDNEFVTLSVCLTSIGIPKGEIWDALREDLKKFAELI